MVVLGVSVGWVSPFLPQLSAAMHVGLDRAGWFVSAVAAGYLVALPGFGELSHRRGAKLVMIVAMALEAAGLLAAAAAPSLAYLLGGALVIGAAQAAVDIGANALVAELNRDRLGPALNYLHMMFGVGAVLGPELVSLALAAGVGYPDCFVAGAAAVAILAALIWGTPAAEIRDDGSAGGGSLALLRHRAIWIIALVLFLYVGAEIGLGGAWLFTYLRESSAMSEPLASAAVSAFWFGLILGRLAGGRLANRISANALALLAAAFSALALGALLALPAGFSLPFAALTGFGFGPIFPSMIAVGAARYPAQVGRMTSLVAAGGALGAIVVPWVMGLALVDASAGAAMTIALAITVAMVLALLPLRTEGTRTARVSRV